MIYIFGLCLAVFEEMKHNGGPLEEGTDYGMKSIRETLKRNVFLPFFLSLSLLLSS